jgi:multicomponent Na+:H+ antiporter subunit B
VGRLLELAALIVVALVLFLAIDGEHPIGTAVREHIVENGVEETGAQNLVTAIYLGYRAFDTLGETIVLLIAVSGVSFFVERRR